MANESRLVRIIPLVLSLIALIFSGIAILATSQDTIPDTTPVTELSSRITRLENEFNTTHEQLLNEFGPCFGIPKGQCAE